MSRTIEFGVRLPTSGPLATRANVARAAREAEQLGFDILWVNDFIVWNSHLDTKFVPAGSAETAEAARARPGYLPSFLESITTASFVAGMTERIRLGIAVLVLPYRQPVIAAKQIATLDVLSGGRFILGVGVGASRESGNQDYEVLGVPRADKYQRTAEYLRAMQAIWTEEHPSFEGQFVRFPPTDLNPKPAQRPYPPLWFGGAGPKSIDLAAEFGTGWVPGRVLPERYPELVPQLRQLARDRGRGEVDFTIGAEILACVGRTTEEAVRASERTIQVVTTGGVVREVAVQSPLAQHALVGSAADVREKVRRYVAAGVHDFEMKFIYHDPDHLAEQLELFSREVIPAFRD